MSYTQRKCMKKTILAAITLLFVVYCNRQQPSGVSTDSRFVTLSPKIEWKKGATLLTRPESVDTVRFHIANKKEGFNTLSSFSNTDFTPVFRRVPAGIIKIEIDGLDSNGISIFYGRDSSSYINYSDIEGEFKPTITVSLRPPLPPVNFAYTNLTATGVVLIWQDQASNEDSFFVYQDGQLYTVLGANSVLSAVSGLQENTPYRFFVKARNDSGFSAPSDTLLLTTLNLPPAAVVVAVTATTTSSVSLSWNANTNTDFSAYKIFQSNTATVDTLSALVATLSAQNTTAYTVTGLSAGMTYYFKVYVFDQGGLSGGSNAVSASTNQANTAPAAVTLNNPADISSSSLTLSWSQNSDTDFASYRIYRSTTAGVSTSSTLVSTITTQTTVNFSVTGLNSGTLYYFKVFVFDQGGLNTGSNEVSAITQPPNVPPTAVTLNNPSNITTSSLTLSWTQNNDTDFESYRIYSSTSSGVTTSSTLLTTVTSAATTTFNVTSLNPNTTYYFKVFVFDQGGLNTGSNEVSATTTAVSSDSGIFTQDANTVVLYRFDNTGASDTLYDVSVNGFHGKLNGPAWTTGIAKQGLNFTSSWMYVNLPKSINAGSSFTLEIWIYPHSSNPGGESMIFRHRADNRDIAIAYNKV